MCEAAYQGPSIPEMKKENGERVATVTATESRTRFAATIERAGTVILGAHDTAETKDGHERSAIPSRAGTRLERERLSSIEYLVCLGEIG